MKQTLSYSLKVWLTTVLVAPLIETVIDSPRFYGKVVLFDAAMNLMIVYGLIISVPLWLLLRLFINFFEKEIVSWMVGTFLLTVLACVFIVITFVIIGGFQYIDGEGFKITITYCLTACISLWTYKLVTKPWNPRKE